MSKRSDLTGLQFVRLRVIGVSSKTDSGGKTYWDCVCEPDGKLVSVRGSHLVGGRIQSCGCFMAQSVSARRKTHGNTVGGHSAEYSAWSNAKVRCESGDANYGGRGITMCDRWLISFENFLADMGRRPSAAHTIDRIDVNGNYEPSNCRWATREEQSNNRRNNLIVSLRGEAMTLSRAAAAVGLPYGTVYQRLRLGWSPDRALGVAA